ncbi:hypothetical protein D3C79_801200 [compost metagenome]
MSSAASISFFTSQPWFRPMRSAAAANTSSGALPAPAPMPVRLASTRSQPCSRATRLLATPRLRLWWACMPVCVAGSSTSFMALKRSAMSHMFIAPPESTT